ncbi:MAG: hypothetical protein Q4P28_06105 [Tissierellia bacterium]|nr:hypothetical protein [Tissierellia bacterium]
MEYILQINKDVLDRFKVYHGEKLLMIGKKSGNKSSFFDGFINASYGKGADFLLNYGDQEIRIERTFFENLKKYDIWYQNSKGSITSEEKNGGYSLKIDFNGDVMQKIVHPGDRSLHVDQMGRILTKRQGFKVYRQMILEMEDSSYLVEMVVLAIFIWDVYMKKKRAFV